MATYVRYGVSIHNGLVKDVEEIRHAIEELVVALFDGDEGNRERLDSDIEVECEENTRDV